MRQVGYYWVSLYGRCPTIAHWVGDRWHTFRGSPDGDHDHEYIKVVEGPLFLSEYEPSAWR